MKKFIKVVCIISSFIAFGLSTTDIDVNSELDPCSEEVVAEANLS